MTFIINGHLIWNVGKLSAPVNQRRFSARFTRKYSTQNIGHIMNIQDTIDGKLVISKRIYGG